MTIPSKGGYDPTSKKRRRKLIEWLLLFFGIEVSVEMAPILAPYVWKTIQDLLRDHETQVIKDSGLATTKDWITHAEDSETGVCDYCQSMADGSPYPIDYDADSHPNCKCSWEPHL